jgi:hypothetical protein
MLIFLRGGCERTMCCLLLTCGWVCQADEELVPGGVGALLISPYSVMWRSYVWAGSVEVLKFCFFLVVFPV